MVRIAIGEGDEHMSHDGRRGRPSMMPSRLANISMPKPSTTFGTTSGESSMACRAARPAEAGLVQARPPPACRHGRDGGGDRCHDQAGDEAVAIIVVGEKALIPAQREAVRRERPDEAARASKDSTSETSTGITEKAMNSVMRAR